MIELIEKYQELGYDVCFMITCAGNYVFEHYIDGVLTYTDIASTNEERKFFYGAVELYLCELKDMN